MKTRYQEELLEAMGIFSDLLENEENLAERQNLKAELQRLALQYRRTLDFKAIYFGDRRAVIDVNMMKVASSKGI